MKHGVRVALAWVVFALYLAALAGLAFGVDERSVAGLLLVALGALGLRGRDDDA